MAAHLSLIGGELGRVTAEAERDGEEVTLSIRDSQFNSCTVVLSLREAVYLITAVQSKVWQSPPSKDEE